MASAFIRSDAVLLMPFDFNGNVYFRAYSLIVVTLYSEGL